MGDSLEDKVHSEQYYLNKEVVLGSVGAIAGTALGAAFAAYILDAKEYVPLIATAGDSVGFTAVYVASAYADRRTHFSRLRDFGIHLAVGGASLIPGSICYHAAHAAIIYEFQKLNMYPVLASVIAILPATLVLLGVANVTGYFLGFTKKKVM
ncbi:hypothetical protein HY484_02475 [Candidatus Woesearchaeota archaeon]|nr:hypothetical protein [Candidatus Woesearchaeota archaeon]